MFAISAVTGQGLPQLVNAVVARLDELKLEEQEKKENEVPFEAGPTREWALPVPVEGSVDA